MSKKLAGLIFRALVVPAVALLVLFLSFRGNGYADTGAYATAAVLVLLFDLATFVGPMARNALLVVGSLVLGLGILDAVAAHMLPKNDLYDSPGLLGPRPVLGWGPTKPGTFRSERRLDGRIIFKATTTIDPDLLRVTSTNPSGPTIGFFGDSFTYGYGLNDDETLPQQFARLEPGFNVVNLAFAAYGPAQVLREMQTGLFDKRLTSPRLFVTLTSPWHAERTSCRNAASAFGPRYIVEDGKPVFAGTCSEGLRGRLTRAFKAQPFYRVFLEPILLRPDHKDIADWITIVGAIETEAREKYGVLLVVLYAEPEPHYLDKTGWSNATIEAALRATGAHVLDTNVATKPGDVLEIPGDGHPTGTWNRLLARKLVDDLETTMPEVLKTGPAVAADRRD